MSDPGIRSFEEARRKRQDDDQAAYLADHGEPSRWEWVVILLLATLVASGAYGICLLIAGWWVSP